MKYLLGIFVAIAVVLMTAGSAHAQAVAGTSIAGTATDSNGDPAPNVCVSVTRHELNTAHSSANFRTDAEGDYLVNGMHPSNPEGLVPGDYTVRFDACQAEPLTDPDLILPEYYEDAGHLDDATHLTVGSGEAKTGIDAVLDIGARITGTISGPGGPMPACASLRGDGIGAGISTGNGAYSYTQLPAGDYKIRFDDCDGESGLGYEWYENAPTLSQAETITLTGGEHRTIDATLDPGGVISGTVTDTGGTPLSSICVRLLDGDDEQVERVDTDVDGEFTFAGLFPADYRVHYADCNYRQNAVPEYFDDAPSLATATEIAVTAGNTSNADAELAPGGSISGLVRGPDQLPLAEVCVQVYDAAGDEVAHTDTAADGTYQVGSLEHSAYRVGFDTCGAIDEEDDIVEYWENEPTLALADPIEVTVGSDRGGVDATLGAADPVAPNTTITSGPASGSSLTVRNASFAFSSTIAGSSFECRIDAGPWESCSSPKPLANLADDSHTFEVKATSPALLVDATPAARTFEVVAGACQQARADLSAAETRLADAVEKKAKAKKKLKKAKKSGVERKIKKAKKKLKQARKQLAAAAQEVEAAEAEVSRVCGSAAV